MSFSATKVVLITHCVHCIWAASCTTTYFQVWLRLSNYAILFAEVDLWWSWQESESKSHLVLL